MVKAVALLCQTLILITALLMESENHSLLIFSLLLTLSLYLFASTSQTFTFFLFSCIASVFLCHYLRPWHVCLILPKRQKAYELGTHIVMLSACHSGSHSPTE